MEAPSFGIHFGNSTLSIAAHFDGRNSVLSNSRGDRTTPAVVSVSDEEQVVGVTAKQRIGRPGVNIVEGMKILLQSYDFGSTVGTWAHSRYIAPVELDEEKGEISYEINGDDGEPRKMIVDEALKKIFEELMEIARGQLSVDAQKVKVVLAVPVEFGEQKAVTVKKAAVAAGFDVIQTISEQAAALLAYDVAQVEVSDAPTCLVYRIGGKTSDISVITTTSGLYSVEGHKFYCNLGGDAFTKALADHFRSEFKSKYKMDPCEDSRRAYHKLHAAAEDVKHVLSTRNTSGAFLESLCNGIDFSSNVTQARFESLISSSADKYLEPIREILKETNRSVEDIDKIILVGGTMKIPRLQKLIKDMFPPEAQLLFSIAPDEVIAVGAAQQSGILVSSPLLSIMRRANGEGDVGLNDEFSEFKELTCLSRGIFFKVGREGAPQCLLRAHTLIPAHHLVHLEPNSVSDGVVGLSVFEADREKDCLGSSSSTHLGDLSLDSLPDDANVSVSCSVTKDGSVTITLRDSASNKMKQLCLEADDNE